MIPNDASAADAAAPRAPTPDGSSQLRLARTRRRRHYRHAHPPSTPEPPPAPPRLPHGAPLQLQHRRASAVTDWGGAHQHGPKQSCPTPPPRTARPHAAPAPATPRPRTRVTARALRQLLSALPRLKAHPNLHRFVPTPPRRWPLSSPTFH